MQRSSPSELSHGGILFHAAIVAREYRNPAVAGTKVGTALIQDGQTITVDGDARIDSLVGNLGKRSSGATHQEAADSPTRRG